MLSLILKMYLQRRYDILWLHWDVVLVKSEKAMAPHSSTLTWRIPGMGEPGGLPSMGSHRVGHDWCDLAAAIICMIIYLTVTQLLPVPGTVLNSLHESHLSIAVLSCERTTSLSILLMRKLRHREAEQQLSDRVKVKFKPKLSWISRSWSFYSNKLFFH